MKIDIHQHLWTEPLVSALAERREPPFIDRDGRLALLYLAGERPSLLDLSREASQRRRSLVDSDGLDRALLCLSSPLGIESLPREQALVLIDAYHDGALALGEPFGVWGAIALDELDPDDVDTALDRGCVGLSVPAGALATFDDLDGLAPVLSRLQARGAPLLVHPGPRAGSPALGVSPADPPWWPAMTRYVAEMQAAWLTFVTAGRAAYPQLPVIFSMLAGLAPLHAERLTARGGPDTDAPDQLTFYECSSYGRRAVRMIGEAVGAEQLLYGSDRPVVTPNQRIDDHGLDHGTLQRAWVRASGAPDVDRPRAGAVR